MDPVFVLLFQQAKKRMWIVIVVAVIVVAGLATGLYAAYSKMSDLQAQRDLAEGKLGEKDRVLMEADAEIGRLNSDLTTEKGLRECAEEALKANHGAWEKERKKYGWKIETLARANADLKSRINRLIGEGGAFVGGTDSELTTGSSSDALTYVQNYLSKKAAHLGWEYDSGRIGVRTTDVFAQPPVADVWTNQHFRVDSMVVRTRTGVKQGYVRLSEVDDDGKVISEVQSVTGDFSWTVEKPRWYDYVLIGARAGAETNRDARFRLPLYGQIGYQSLSGTPWAVTIDPYASVDGQNDDGLHLDYGGGLYVHIRKP